MIWQNLLFGVTFIVVLLVLGATGRINPMVAAFLHMVSSAVVIFNSARLVRFGEHLEGHALTATPSATASPPIASAEPQPLPAPRPACGRGSSSITKHAGRQAGPSPDVPHQPLLSSLPSVSALVRYNACVFEEAVI